MDLYYPILHLLLAQCPYCVTHSPPCLVPFQSPNKPTIPQERIRPLTSLDHPQSPFYDTEGGPITALARVVVERIARKVTIAYASFIQRSVCVCSLSLKRCECSCNITLHTVAIHVMLLWIHSSLNRQYIAIVIIASLWKTHRKMTMCLSPDN